MNGSHGWQDPGIELTWGFPNPGSARRAQMRSTASWAISCRTKRRWGWWGFRFTRFTRPQKEPLSTEKKGWKKTGFWRETDGAYIYIYLAGHCGYKDYRVRCPDDWYIWAFQRTLAPGPVSQYASHLFWLWQFHFWQAFLFRVSIGPGTCGLTRTVTYMLFCFIFLHLHHGAWTFSPSWTDIFNWCLRWLFSDGIEHDSNILCRDRMGVLWIWRLSVTRCI